MGDSVGDSVVSKNVVNKVGWPGPGSSVGEEVEEKEEEEDDDDESYLVLPDLDGFDVGVDVGTYVLWLFVGTNVGIWVGLDDGCAVGPIWISFKL